MAFINHKEPSVNNRHRTNGVCVGFIITCPGFHSLHMIVRKERQLQDDRSAALPDIATVSVGGDEGMGQKISQAQVAVQRFRIDGSRRWPSHIVEQRGLRFKTKRCADACQAFETVGDTGNVVAALATAILKQRWQFLFRESPPYFRQIAMWCVPHYGNLNLDFA